MQVDTPRCTVYIIYLIPDYKKINESAGTVNDNL